MSYTSIRIKSYGDAHSWWYRYPLRRPEKGKPISSSGGIRLHLDPDNTTFHIHRYGARIATLTSQNILTIYEWRVPGGGYWLPWDSYNSKRRAKVDWVYLTGKSSQRVFAFTGISFDLTTNQCLNVRPMPDFRLPPEPKRNGKVYKKYLKGFDTLREAVRAAATMGMMENSEVYRKATAADWAEALKTGGLGPIFNEVAYAGNRIHRRWNYTTNSVQPASVDNYVDMYDHIRKNLKFRREIKKCFGVYSHNKSR